MTEELDELRGMLDLLGEIEGAGEYATKSMADFGLAIRSAVRGLWKGVLNRFDFNNTMTLAIRRQLTIAWHEGAAMCGIRPEELSPPELLRLYMIIQENIGYIPGFADSIEAGSQANGGKLGPLISRASIWTNKYMQAQSLGQQMACRDQKLRWDLGRTKVHCEDCLKLNGRVYRASIWEKYDIYPKSPNLACGGWLCDCRFTPTNEPGTPGRPPRLSG